jgi:hypothetical protein
MLCKGEGFIEVATPFRNKMRNLKGGDMTYSHGLWARHFLHSALWKVSKPTMSLKERCLPLGLRPLFLVNYRTRGSNKING